MQERASLNFEPLRGAHSELANVDGFAEHYAHTGPESALVTLCNFAERTVDHIYTRLRLPRALQSNFMNLLTNAAFTCWQAGLSWTNFMRCESSAIALCTLRMSRRLTHFAASMRLPACSVVPRHISGWSGQRYLSTQRRSRCRRL